MDLPADLQLPLESGAPWWYWAGGRPAMDLVNTRRERWWRDVETLVTTTDLASWLAQARLVETTSAVSPRLLIAARALREAVDAGVRAQLAGAPMRGQDVSTIDAWLRSARLIPHLAIEGDARPRLEQTPPADPARHALALIAHDAAVMLGTDERRRIRVCASETCSARFFDRSPSGRRRWCSMQACGNVAKARRHRARAASRLRSDLTAEQ